MEQGPSLAVDEKIEAFCRELANALRQITGYTVPSTDQEFKAMAQRVQATPVQRTTSRRTK